MVRFILLFFYYSVTVNILSAEIVYICANPDPRGKTASHDTEAVGSHCHVIDTGGYSQHKLGPLTKA